MGTNAGYWFQCPFDDRGASPLLWSNHVHVRRAERLGRRGLVMVPFGGIGQHRYPLAGSGDTPAAWATLAFQIYQSATAANLGVHWSHDLGGFDPDQSNTRPGWPHQPLISDDIAGYNFTLKMCSWPELWTRWVQFGGDTTAPLSHLHHNVILLPYQSCLKGRGRLQCFRLCFGRTAKLNAPASRGTTSPTSTTRRPSPLLSNAGRC